MQMQGSQVEAEGLQGAAAALAQGVWSCSCLPSSYCPHDSPLRCVPAFAPCPLPHSASQCRVSVQATGKAQKWLLFRACHASSRGLRGKPPETCSACHPLDGALAKPCCCRASTTTAPDCMHRACPTAEVHGRAHNLCNNGGMSTGNYAQCSCQALALYSLGLWHLLSRA